MQSSPDRLIRYLDDAWALEKTLVTTLKDMADEVNDSGVRALFLEHRAITHQHEENLEARLRALGKEPSRTKSFLNQIGGKMGDMLHGAHDEYDKTTLNLMKAFATENLEMAVYEALASFATEVGDLETEKMAQQHLAQEKEAAAKIWPQIAPVSRLTAMESGERR